MGYFWNLAVLQPCVVAAYWRLASELVSNIGKVEAIWVIFLSFQEDTGTPLTWAGCGSPGYVDLKTIVIANKSSTS